MEKFDEIEITTGFGVAVGGLAVVAGILCGVVGIDYFKNKEQENKQVIEYTFEEGEHMVLVPINEQYKILTTRQIEYHDGYDIKYAEEDYLIYVNTEKVKCIGTLDKEENAEFIEFGTPVEEVKTLQYTPTTEEH